MINMYDFVRSNSSYFDQLSFGNDREIFIDYLCPIYLAENEAAVKEHAAKSGFPADRVEAVGNVIDPVSAE